MANFDSYIDSLDMDFWHELCARKGQLRQYKKGEYFVKSGEMARYMGIVRQGYFKYTVTSIGGLSGEASAPAYSATKAYQINYTQALRKKSRKTGICVTEVRPGLVDTDMAKGEGLFWVMPPEKVALQMASAIARRRSKVVVTKRWRIISFLLKHFQ